MNMNVPEVSDIRIRAAALYLLEQSAQANGDCYLFRHDLITQTAEFLNNVQINVNMVADVVSKAADLKIVIDDEGRVYPPDLHRAERDAASRLLAILTDQLPPALIGQDLEKAITKALSSAGLELHPIQIEAIDRTMRNKVSVITGGPGVGKTTITRAIVAGYDAAEVPLTLLAPTGKAAKRMTEVIGRQAHTIHRRLWSLNKDVKDGSVELEDAQLRGVVIVDEVSMVDIKTLAWLLSFVHPSAVLVFVGDADQLPSVGPGSVLRDLLNTPSMAATRLTQIFRQAAASDIVRHAHAINQGMTPPIERLSSEIVRARGWPKTDFFLIEEEDQTKMADKAVWAATHMAPRLGFDPLADVQVLTPMKRGDAGVGNLNRVLQGALNPSPGDSIKRFDLATWGVGDRLMQLKNNYDYDIYNGDQGRIVRFTRKQDDSDPTHLVLDVDGREVEIEREDFHQLTLAYAATVHKSQGSEFPFVVICLHTSHFTLLQRNLLYTGVTRGKKCVVLIAHPQALSMAVANNKVSRRNTYLTQRLTPYQKAA
jgi:exodeoxyribonuclease V alpha subunit